MRNLRASVVLLLLSVFPGLRQAAAQEPKPGQPALDIVANTEAFYNESNNIATASNGVVVKFTDTNGLTVVEADRASIHEQTGDIFAEGKVRIQNTNGTWTGERLHYNYQTKIMEGESFRLGKPPFYLAGEKLHGAGEGTNAVYSGTNGTFTTDDYREPLQKIRAKRFTMVPGQYVEAYDATVYVDNVPVFYLPYYRRDLVKDPNGLSLLPGYRSSFGPYLLSTYTWVINQQLTSALHMDYRESRGFGVGPDLDYKFGPWGDGKADYYYARDHDPGTDPYIGTAIPRDRERAYFSYNASPLTNLSLMSQVAQQSDPYIVRDFFESQYDRDIQPNTFASARQAWPNWSLEALAQPRINPFWETVERLPEVRLNGFRQEIGSTPLYYESESSAGYYRRLFADTNTLSTGDFSGSRADTFHQVTLPQNFFGWLNVTPRIGGRVTYYDATSGPGATTTNHVRDVFNTGAEVSFTASRVWQDAKNSFLDVDGLRHIIQPSVNYVYIPQPSVLPSQLPQFDYELTNSLRLQPLDFPDFNSIDSINSENTIRYGLNNRLQTKRKGQIDDLVNWGVYMDWHLRPRNDQSTLSDIYSDFTLKPRSWIVFSSSTRYSIVNGQFNLAEHGLTLQPNNTWNWSVSHLYLRNGSIFGLGDNVISSLFFYRFNENWGARTEHIFDARTGTLQEQDYSVYRDLRSWTAALTFRALNNLGRGNDYTVAFSFSLKSFPHYALGADSVTAAPLVGY